MSKGKCEGKVAIVTGAAQGIGLAIAKSLSKEGAHVVITDIKDKEIKKTAEQINGLAIKVDVSNEKDVKFMVNTLFGIFQLLI